MRDIKRSNFSKSYHTHGRHMDPYIFLDVSHHFECLDIKILNFFSMKIKLPLWGSNNNNNDSNTPIVVLPVMRDGKSLMVTPNWALKNTNSVAKHNMLLSTTIAICKLFATRLSRSGHSVTNIHQVHFLF